MIRIVPVLAFILTSTTARADTKADPAITDICEGIGYNVGSIDHWKSLIKKERTNPGGVVDLEDLHFWGEQLQCRREWLDGWRAEYLHLKGKPIAPNFCATPPYADVTKAAYNDGRSTPDMCTDP